MLQLVHAMMARMDDDRHIPGLELPRTLLHLVGVSTYTLIGVAFLHSAWSVARVAVASPFDGRTPYAMHFFVLYISLVLVILFCLLFCAHQLIQLRTNVRHTLLIVSITSIVVYLAPSFFPWRSTNQLVAMSALSVTSIGLGGLGLFLVTLHPLWAPTIVYWAHRRLNAKRAERHQAGLCIHCGYDLRGAKGRCPECGLD
ncbi:MAG: hypothetical protein EA377_07700 [Phycisphaerales bacterium]|nr:MAG: hypothetical protein EA377_07700 [Phycisphaerales bacterium]